MLIPLKNEEEHRVAQVDPVPADGRAQEHSLGEQVFRGRQ